MPTPRCFPSVDTRGWSRFLPTLAERVIAPGAQSQSTETTARPPSRRVLIYGFRTPAHHERCRALVAGVRKPPKNETAGEGTNSRAAFGVSARTGGRVFVQPERYGTKIAGWGKVTSPTL